MRCTSTTTTRAVAGCLLALLAAPPALAQTPELLASHRDWTVYLVDGERGKVCYIASEPKKQEGNYAKRGSPAVMVALLPGEPASEQVSVQPGYAYRKGSDVEVAIGARKFGLFTQGEHAWARTEADDKALIDTMRKAGTMSVRGTSVRDTFSVDTYSLGGFGAAYDAMRNACK